MKKNLKRLLCLVLVVSLVCTLGVTAFASSSLTAYTDVDDITYAEAVDVLTGAGILVGSDGTFRPSDTVTRAEAAKIISYLALGADTAEALAATTAPFDDVPLTHWAVGYIAYCASAGIINGYGDGNFGPDDSVTLYELAKMLLCTLGYGVNGEYTGTAWQIQTAADAGVYGIFDGKEGSVNGTAAATREETALLAFNALVNVAQAKYNETFAEYYVGSSALNAISITIKGDYQFKADIDANTYGETAYLYTIGYQKYDLTKVDKNQDAFGRTMYAWQCDGEEISSNYVYSNADYTIDGKASFKAVKNAVGSTNTASDVVWTVYEDGAVTTYNATNVADWTDDDTDFIDRGQTMEVYVTTTSTSRSVKAVIITDYLAQVTDVDEDDGDITLTLDVYMPNAAKTGSDNQTGLEIDSDTADNLAGYAEDDWVIVNCATDGSWSVEAVAGAAATVEGVPTAYASSAITIDGTKYNYSGTFKRTTDSHDGYGYGCTVMQEAYSDNYDDTYILYLDTYGNLIGFEAADETNSTSVTKNYLYVKGVDADVVGFDDAYVKVRAQFTDGTTDVIYLNVSDADDASDARVTIKGGSTYYLTSAAADSTVLDAGDLESAIYQGVYSYTVNSSGYYTLKALNGTTEQQTLGIIVDDVTSVNAYASAAYTTTEKVGNATKNTKLVLVEDNKTYTGYSNFPDESWTNDTLVLTSSSNNNTITYIYVFGGDVSTTEDLIYAVYKNQGDSTSDGTYYNFFVNGSVESYLFDTDAATPDTAYEAGWIKVGSDGYAEFEAYSDGTAQTDNGVKSDYGKYYLYVGKVTAIDSYTITIENGTDEKTFALVDDYESTRVKTWSNATSSSAAEGDYVWVFTESDTEEAVAVVAVNPDAKNGTGSSASTATTVFTTGTTHWVTVTTA